MAHGPRMDKPKQATPTRTRIMPHNATSGRDEVARKTRQAKMQAETPRMKKPPNKSCGTRQPDAARQMPPTKNKTVAAKEAFSRSGGADAIGLRSASEEISSGVGA